MNGGSRDLIRPFTMVNAILNATMIGGIKGEYFSVEQFVSFASHQLSREKVDPCQAVNVPSL
jgi:hypothetical protein